MQLHKLLHYDGIVDGKRYKTKARYNKTPKEEAMSKLTKKQQQLIDELTSTNNRLDKISFSCFENGISSYAYDHYQTGGFPSEISHQNIPEAII